MGLAGSVSPGGGRRHLHSGVGSLHSLTELSTFDGDEQAACTCVHKLSHTGVEADNPAHSLSCCDPDSVLSLKVGRGICALVLVCTTTSVRVSVQCLCVAVH